ncbi:Metallo-dependent phosphatase [Aureobasidium subglaciale]|nr:Metallo-dependent phosphatase [Aureobasidium subglaciale]KAI5220515.1 Metallo-dependent phosphatase [Aureobasidium subglaciale]KAI5258323.1 Metallo-dependent phosphatase [Aureobasidium subglaciale]
MLGEIEAELKLVIAGNHDLELDGDYWLKHLDEEGGDEPEEHDQAVAIMKSPLARDAGVIYLDEGTHHFTLQNGASFSIYVSLYSPAFGDWAFGSVPSHDRFTDLQSPVDIFMTHGPPKGILDLCPQDNVGCEHTLRALQRVKPMLHCFEHIHEGYGAQTITWDDKHPRASQPASVSKHDRWNIVCKSNKAQETLLINAAIQGDNGAFTLRLEEGHRVYDDRWRLDHSVVDTELDVKIEFGAAEQVMNEISAFIDSSKASLEDIEAVILKELTLAVFGSNKLDKVGLGLDETFHLCMRILRGEIDVEYEDRTEDCQKKIDAFALKGLKSGEVKVARSRREVVQHAAAFRHIITVFVKRNQSMTEELIKETDAILVRGLSGEDAGVLSSKSYATLLYIRVRAEPESFNILNLSVELREHAVRSPAVGSVLSGSPDP